VDGKHKIFANNELQIHNLQLAVAHCSMSQDSAKLSCIMIM
jgi:hypothetical protein